MAQIDAKVCTVRVPDQGEITVKVNSPCRATSDIPTLILAHGAHNDLDFPLLAYLATELPAAEAAQVVRFNFLYRERGLSTIDPAPLLEETYLAVYQYVRNELVEPNAPVFVGGKSLGARTAAELVSRRSEGNGVEAAGLVELGYPLHSPGRPNRLYLDPLRSIDIPSLFFAGTNDPFCDPELLRPVLERLKHPGTMYVLEGADHSLQVADKQDQGKIDTYPVIAREIMAFFSQVLGQRVRTPDTSVQADPD